jgi:NodT family efflux transporter outer membrane factor (OMF) lipoprotein
MRPWSFGVVAVAVTTAAMLAGGCAVGPRYVRPTTPVAPVDAFKELDGWHAAQPGDEGIRGNWWELFGDERLNRLEDELTASNQDLQAAQARFREARALVGVSRASQLPTISVAPSAAAVRLSGNTAISTATLNEPATDVYTLPLDLSYEIDAWGRVARTVAAARDRAQASAADLQTVHLSLQAELAFDYFELRSADAQAKLLDDTVAAYTEALQLTTNRFEGGAAARSDVAQARTQLDATRVQRTDVAVQRARDEHAIASLLGKPPAALSLPSAPLDLQPPPIPIGLPSQLLERRADVASAERRTAAANEQIGIARAAFFPTILLSAAGGFEGNTLANWFAWPSRFWALGPAAVQTLFDAGRRHAISDATLAAYDATVADYRQSALTAFQQVEDHLAALRVLEQEAQQQAEATASAQESLRIFNDRYIGGADPYLQVITAQTIALANARNDVDILRRRMDASVLLIKALGGGWTAADLPVAAAAPLFQ